MKAHFETQYAQQGLALSLELSEFSESGTLKHNNLHARLKDSNRATEVPMLTADTRSLARQLYDARKSRTQLRHFSRKHPR